MIQYANISMPFEEFTLRLQLICIVCIKNLGVDSIDIMMEVITSLESGILTFCKKIYDAIKKLIIIIFVQDSKVSERLGERLNFLLMQTSRSLKVSFNISSKF